MEDCNFSVTDRKRPAILRFINYATADLNQFEKSAKYIFRDSASAVHLRYARFLDKAHPKDSMALLERHWNGDIKGRLFKHLICAFGDPMMQPETGFEVMHDFAKAFADYPFLFAIHTDVPRRIHAHALLGMTNQRTGKRYSQDWNELHRAKTQLNLLLQSHGLCPIRGEGRSVRPSEGCVVTDATERDPPSDVAWLEDIPTTASGTGLASWQGPTMTSQKPMARVVDPFQQFSFAVQMAYFMKGRNFHV